MDAQEAIIEHGMIVDDLVHRSLILLKFKLRKGFEGVRPIRIYEYYPRQKMSIDESKNRLDKYDAYLDSDRCKDLETLGEQIITIITDWLCGESKMRKAVLARQIAAKRKELEGDGPTDGMEKMLIDRIIILWLDVYHMDLRLLTHEAELPYERIDNYDKRRECADGKPRQALKTLAFMREKINTVRKAAWPDRLFNSRLGNVYQESKN